MEALATPKHIESWMFLSGVAMITLKALPGNRVNGKGMFLVIQKIRV